MLSAAIGDAPHLVSIRPDGETLGRARYRRDGRPESIVQIHLAGFAAEELLKGCRSKQFIGSELSCSITALTKPEFAFVGEGLETCDQFLAVKDIIDLGTEATNEAIRAQVERFYAAAKDSLEAIWPVVRSVAKALLEHTEIDYGLFRRAVGNRDIYGPVFEVQAAHGLMELNRPSATNAEQK